MTNQDNSSSKPGRKRGLTEVTLGWIADRFRKAEELKKKIAQGNYSVDSEKIAQAIVDPSTNKG